LGAQRRMRGARVSQAADSQLEGRQLLAELIVHLARDTAPLVLLREHQTRKELGPRTFGTLALGDLLAEQRVRPGELGGAIANARLQFFLGAAQHFLRPFPFGQVEMRADDADNRPAGPAPHRKSTREYVDVVTVLVAQAELSFVALHAAYDDTFIDF